MIGRLIAIVLFSWTLALSAVAQTVPDYPAWTQIADRAERVIDAGRASDVALEQLRVNLVEWRAQFREAQNINSTRIETLRAQLVALGVVPEGVTEPTVIAEQRTGLTNRLAEAEVPVRQADAELLRAIGLISEIDALIAARQAGAWFQLGPSPLNPANWTEAITVVFEWLRALGTEIVRVSSSQIHLTSLSDNGPLVVFYTLVGVVLLARSRRWVDRLMRRPVAHEATSPRARLMTFGLSLLHSALRLVAWLALIMAFSSTGMIGLRGSVVMGVLPTTVLSIVLARWLGQQVFPIRETAPRPLNLTATQRAQGRWAASGLGVIIALSLVLSAVAESEGFAESDRLVQSFPLIVLTGFLLLRLGRFLMIHAANEAKGSEDVTILNRIYATLGRVIIGIALLGPTLAGIGYFSAGTSFLFPSVSSLALMAILGILQRLVVDIYGAIVNKSEGLNDALIPTLIGFALAIMTLPFFALIWGMRAAQLGDLWQQFLAGFSIGGVQISPSSFVMFVIVFVIGYTATRLVQGTLRTSVLPKTGLDAGGHSAVLTGTGYVGIFLSALIAITTAGIDLSSLAIVAGALSVGIGFGLQTIVSNFVSGIILLVERPIKQGDWIEVNGMAGYVRDISVRSTRLETFDRSDVIVPNADLISGVVTNMTHNNNTGRVIVPVGVAYGTDTRRVETILKEIASAHPMVLLRPEPAVIFQGFGADSLDFEIRAILRDVNWVLTVKSDMNHAIAARFGAEGIEIPFAQRDVWLRNPEALGAMAGTVPADTGPSKTPINNFDDPDVDGDS
jgi:potassium efflux system protein